jgi:hypothetical protein
LSAYSVSSNRQGSTRQKWQLPRKSSAHNVLLAAQQQDCNKGSGVHAFTKGLSSQHKVPHLHWVAASSSLQQPPAQQVTAAAALYCSDTAKLAAVTNSIVAVATQMLHQQHHAAADCNLQPL